MKKLNMEDINFDLTGKTAVVVGGNTGIGKSVALGLANAGADVVPTARRVKKLEETVDEIKEMGRESIVITTDITKEEEVKQLYEKTMDKFGKVDILVNSAGTNVKKHFLSLETEEWDKVVDVCLKGVYLTCKYFGKNMVENKQGKVINIASMGSYLGITRSSAYCASKGGVNQLTKVLALEWAEHDVNVNAIAPGFFRTELTAPVFEQEEAYNRIMGKIAMDRSGETEDIIGAAVFLASNASNYITGETIAVDGGFLAFGI